MKRSVQIQQVDDSVKHRPKEGCPFSLLYPQLPPSTFRGLKIRYLFTCDHYIKGDLWFQIIFCRFIPQLNIEIEEVSSFESRLMNILGVFFLAEPNKCQSDVTRQCVDSVMGIDRFMCNLR